MLIPIGMVIKVDKTKDWVRIGQRLNRDLLSIVTDSTIEIISRIRDIKKRGDHPASTSPRREEIPLYNRTEVGIIVQMTDGDNWIQEEVM